MRLLPRILTVLACAVLLIQDAAAQVIPSIPYNLTNGSLADATQVMGNFNTIVTDVNANAATNGANSNITALSGLTTPLAHALGGTVVYTGGTTGGSGNAQTLASVTPSAFALTAGNIVTGLAGFTNTGATTLAVNGTTATAVMKVQASGLVALVGGEITTAGGYAFLYDGTEFILLNPTIGVDGTNFAYAGANITFGSAPSLPATTVMASTPAQTTNSTAVATTAYTNGVARGSAVLTSGTTFTTAANVVAGTQFKFTLTGGGGGSGGVSNGSSPGGGAGSTCIYYATGLSPSTGYTYAIGGAGAAGSNSPGNGGAGGNTTFTNGATTVTAPGGNGSTATSSSGNTAAPSGGGACTNATFSIPGGGGATGAFQGNANFGGAGGASYWGGGGATPTNGGGGQAGQAPGSGGSGTDNNSTAAGAAGAAGVILVEWW